MYESVRAGRRARPKAGLLAAVLACVAVLAAGTSLIVYSCWYQLRFRQFLSDLSNSTVYAYRNDGLQLTVEGRTVRVEGDPVYAAFQAVADNEMGRMTGPPEREPDAVMTYGDGASLELWDVMLEGYETALPGGRQTGEVRGVALRYTDPEGGTYCYDTDQIDFDYLIRKMTWSR